MLVGFHRWALDWVINIYVYIYICICIYELYKLQWWLIPSRIPMWFSARRTRAGVREDDRANVTIKEVFKRHGEVERVIMKLVSIDSCRWFKGEVFHTVWQERRPLMGVELLNIHQARWENVPAITHVLCVASIVFTKRKLWHRTTDSFLKGL